MPTTIDFIEDSSRTNTRFEDVSGRKLEYKDFFSRLVQPIPKIRKKFMPKLLPWDDFLEYLDIRKFWAGCHA